MSTRSATLGPGGERHHPHHPRFPAAHLLDPDGVRPLGERPLEVLLQFSRRRDAHHRARLHHLRTRELPVPKFRHSFATIEAVRNSVQAASACLWRSRRRAIAFPFRACAVWMIWLSIVSSPLLISLARIKGRSLRGLCPWISRAISSLPVPGLPQDEHVGAGRRHQPDAIDAKRVKSGEANLPIVLLIRQFVGYSLLLYLQTILCPQLIAHLHPIMPILNGFLSLCCRGFDGSEFGQWNRQTILFPSEQ